MKKQYSVIIREDQLLKLREESVDKNGKIVKRNGSLTVRLALDMYIQHVYTKMGVNDDYSNLLSCMMYNPGGGDRKVYSVRLFDMQIQFLKNSKEKTAHVIQRALDVYFTWKYLK